MLALIKYGKPLLFMVTDGVSDDAFSTMDTGMKRTVGQVLSMSGIANYNVHASSIGLYFGYIKGLNSHNRRKETNYNSVDVIEFYNNNIDLCCELESFASICYSKRRLLTKSIIYSFLLKLILIDKKDKDKSMNFFRELFGINPLTNTTPSLLTDRLIKVGMSKLSMPKRELNALLIKAYNHYANGTNLKTLRWIESSEEFPIIK